MSNTSQKLSVLEKIGYGLGDFAANLIFQTLLTFLAFFYTDVYKIPAGTASVIIFVGGFIGAFFNIIMGIIADRTKTKQSGLLAFGAAHSGVEQHITTPQGIKPDFTGGNINIGAAVMTGADSSRDGKIQLFFQLQTHTDLRHCAVQQLAGNFIFQADDLLVQLTAHGIEF